MTELDSWRYCRCCGTDLLADEARPALAVQPAGGSEPSVYLCRPCGRNFETEPARREYLRLAFLV